MKRADVPTTAFIAPLPPEKAPSHLAKNQRAYPEAVKNEWFGQIAPALAVQLTWGNRIPLAARRLAAVNATKDSIYRRYFRRPSHVLEAADAFHVGPATFALERDNMRVGQVARELVFDFDLPDLDANSLRTCECRGQKQCCKDCWEFLIFARLTTEYRLEQYWGVRGLLWVFSGSKGCHATSNSHAAAMFDRATRAAVVKTLIQPFNPDTDRQLLKELRRLARARVFRDDAGWLGRSTFRARLLQELAVHNLQTPLESTWDGLHEALVRERGYIEELYPDNNNASRHRRETMLAELDQDPWTTSFWHTMTGSEEYGRDAWAVICSCFFIPYLDAAVTEDPEHLNKAAFAIHSGTQRVALPLDRRGFETFDPSQVPTAPDLLANADLAQTWLAPALTIYDSWLRNAPAKKRRE